MEQKINIAEILRDCQKGMELYSPIFGTVYFEGIRDTGRAILIDVTTSCNTSVQFYSDGKFNTYYSESEVTLFPSKSQRDWSKFQGPFKDGDIVVYDNPHRDNLQVFVFKSKEENNILSYCYLMLDGDELDLEEGMYCVTRLAKEEEKQKLFDAIKAKGYKWNAETKTLEKLIEPKFKDGDVVFVDAGINYRYVVILKRIENNLVYVYCIHYAGDKFSTNNCLCEMADVINMRLATEEEKEKLFKAIKDNGYKWNAETKTLEKFKVGDRIKHKYNKREIYTIAALQNNHYILDDNDCALPFESQDQYELAPDKFDFSALVPFESKVLVRDSQSTKWLPAIWGFYNEDNSSYPYEIIGGNSFSYCIPYEGNEHLRGTTNDCDDYYKDWE